MYRIYVDDSNGDLWIQTGVYAACLRKNHVSKLRHEKAEVTESYRNRMINAENQNKNKK